MQPETNSVVNSLCDVNRCSGAVGNFNNGQISGHMLERGSLQYTQQYGQLTASPYPSPSTNETLFAITYTQYWTPSSGAVQQFTCTVRFVGR